MKWRVEGGPLVWKPSDSGKKVKCSYLFIHNYIQSQYDCYTAKQITKI